VTPKKSAFVSFAVPLALFCMHLASAPLAAQSCVLTRLDSPVLNAFEDEYNAADLKWQVGFGWRYGYSHRHFVGTDEQEERREENSQVVNNVNLADLTLKYNHSPRLSFTLGIPYLMATRDGALRDANRHVVRRYERSSTEGLGDITLVGKWLAFDPATHRDSNFSIGFGVKLPTGDYKQKERRLELVNGVEVETTGIADYSVQPGDGGYGIILELGGYKVLNATGSLAGYASATYIFTPETTNGVDRPGAAIAEEEVSVTDQYVGRLGLQVGPGSWNGWSAGLGGRIEGIPPHDAFGSSYGRRRPGYMVSIEPSISWSKGVNSVSLAVPYAIERNRQRSVSDHIRGTHGDAAFPDYVILAGYTRRF
jgi:hypothetical protein